MGRNITKIEAFKTSDGRVFEGISEATGVQRSINLREDLENIMDRHYFNGIKFEDIINALIGDIDKLSEAVYKYNMTDKE